MLTVKQVAERLKKTPQRIRQMIKEGKIKAELREKKTHYWMIYEKEIEELLGKDQDAKNQV